MKNVRKVYKMLNVKNCKGNNGNSNPQKKAVDKYRKKVDNLSIAICKECKQLLDNYCKDMHKTKKEVVEAAIFDYIDNH